MQNIELSLASHLSSEQPLMGPAQMWLGWIDFQLDVSRLEPCSETEPNRCILALWDSQWVRANMDPDMNVETQN